MKFYTASFAISAIATVGAVLLVVLVGIQYYGVANLDWLFTPIETAGIPFAWMLWSSTALAIVAYVVAVVGGRWP